MCNSLQGCQLCQPVLSAKWLVRGRRHENHAVSQLKTGDSFPWFTWSMLPAVPTCFLTQRRSRCLSCGV